jgi:hypothetical protein
VQSEAEVPAAWPSPIFDPLTVYLENLQWNGNDSEFTLSAGVAPPAGVYAALCRGTSKTNLAVVKVFPFAESGPMPSRKRVNALLLGEAITSQICGFTLFGWIRIVDHHHGNMDDREEVLNLYNSISTRTIGLYRSIRPRS